MTEVVLVNDQDEAIGTMEKLEAHQKGELHRAFSIFIYNGRGEMLLQQRAMSKYHNGGLWTNACCSHPNPGEAIEAAASRRLKEELGFTAPIKKIFSFTYKAEFANGLTEYEFDHVFVGTYDGKINADPSEVMNVKYITQKQLQDDLKHSPAFFTAWFKIALSKIDLYHTLGGNL
ncbi:MAG: isopentenyl-diphosphate Delta-isomerase [Ginsengibacter sp.]